eukprot:gb/GEZN01005492.1/.p1 GENE.gb/GEZN01005492.1/~~gb/GEZN01005492.1/.p1  ORF type:complete len:569 (-),score=67.48 gb/GEZN01005492.1/:61-1767(-)
METKQEQTQEGCECLTPSDIRDNRLLLQKVYAEGLELTIDQTDLLLRFLRYNSELMDKLKDQTMSQRQDTLFRAGVLVKMPPAAKTPKTPTSKKTSTTTTTKKADSKGKTPTARCPVCDDDFVLQPYLKQVCGHALCSTCWPNLLRAELSQGRKALYSRCPGLDASGKNTCSLGLPYSTAKRFLNVSQLSVLDGMLDALYIESSSNAFHCPGRGCSRVFWLSKTVTLPREVQCTSQSCRTTVCSMCRSPPHWPCPCDLVAQWKTEMEVESEEAASLALIKSLSKPCPRCSVHIMKEPGCNHIRCSACNFHFCWQCLGEMAAGTWAHPDWDTCKVRQLQSTEGEVSQEETARVQSNMLLSSKKHFRREIEEARKDCETSKQLLASATSHTSEAQDPSALTWLTDVCKVVLETADFLKWTLVFSFFLGTEEREEVESLFNSLRASFGIVLAQLETGLEDLEGLLDTEERVQKFAKALLAKRKRLEAQVEISKSSLQSLSGAGRGEGKEWSCLRCDYVGPTQEHQEGKNVRRVVACPKCSTCRAHGDKGCLILECKGVTGKKSRTGSTADQ